MAQNDPARDLANESLEELEKRYRRMYNQAANEMRGKQQEFLKEYAKERSERLKALDTTKEAMAEYDNWLEGQARTAQWLDDMVDTLAEKATDVNVEATRALDDMLPAVYAESANYAAFTVDSAIGFATAFNLVNEDAVRNLIMMDGPILHEVAFPKVDQPKDYRWNRQRFKSAIVQGILQGESIPNIVKRTRGIFGSNAAAAYRAARTATTSAENAGRMSSYKRAERLGIDLMVEWSAVLDGRTRDSHRKLDGERVKVGEPFQGERSPIRFPGDPQAHPSESYNCRCSIDGAQAGIDKPLERWSRLPNDVTYDDWKQGAYHTDKMGRETRKSKRERGAE